MIPATAVEVVCANIGLDFTNQGMGSLALQLAHQHEIRPFFHKTKSIRRGSFPQLFLLKHKLLV